ncbi:MAG: 50S ribosomal protein L13 [Thermoplasmata archaeon]
MIVIDATGKILGRLCSEVAKLLLDGEEVVVLNAEKAIITGSREQIIEDYLKKRHAGNVRKRKGPFYPRMPDRILRRTVRGMLPYAKSRRGTEAYRRLRVYIGMPEEFKNYKIVSVPEAEGKGKVKFISLGELSRELGAKF